KLDPLPTCPHQGRHFGHEASCLTRKDLLDGFALALVGPLINEDTVRDRRLPSPEIAVKPQYSNDTETIKPDAAVGPLTDMIGHDAVAVIVGWGLSELAGTGNVTTANVKPIPLHPPLRNVRHSCPPCCQENLSAPLSLRHADWAIRMGTYSGMSQA